MAYIYIDDGGPESEEYENNYYYYDDKDVNVYLRIHEALRDTSQSRSELQTRLFSICNGEALRRRISRSNKNSLSWFTNLTSSIKNFLKIEND